MRLAVGIIEITYSRGCEESSDSVLPETDQEPEGLPIPDRVGPCGES